MKITEGMRVNGQNARARMLKTDASLNLADWMQTIEDFNGLCAYCLTNPYDVLEHFQLVSVAGTTVNNCLPACLGCNSKKRHHTGNKLIALFGQDVIDRLQTYLDARQPTERTGAKRSPYRASIRPEDEDPYRTLRQASEVLGISMHTLHYHIKKHDIPVYKFQFHLSGFITREALDFLKLVAGKRKKAIRP